MAEHEIRVREILRYLRGQQAAMVRLLEKFVRCESPSFDKGAVDRFGEMIAAQWERRAAKVRVLRQAKRGNHGRAEIRDGEGSGSGQIMILGHLDTVYPLGTIETMPFRVSGGRAWGPGKIELKGRHVQALVAAVAVRATR